MGKSDCGVSGAQFTLTSDAVCFIFLSQLTYLLLVCHVFLVLVDDRNLRVADFAQFWATAKVYSHTHTYLLSVGMLFLFAGFNDTIMCLSIKVVVFYKLLGSM